jgi:hypothetical protein
MSRVKVDLTPADVHSSSASFRKAVVILGLDGG